MQHIESRVSKGVLERKEGEMAIPKERKEDTMKNLDFEEAKEFLEKHFATINEETERIEIRLIKGKFVGSLFFPYQDISFVLPMIDEFVGKRCGIYFGVNPRPTSEKKTEKDIKTSICLFVDIDVGPDKPLKSQEEALSFIRGFQPKPDKIVDSGNGVHCYWYLEKPVPITSDKQRVEIKAILSGLIQRTHADKSGSSLERVMRLPGTINFKNGRRCRVLEG